MPALGGTLIGTRGKRLMHPRGRTERSFSDLLTSIVNGPFELLETVDRQRSIFRYECALKNLPILPQSKFATLVTDSERNRCAQGDQHVSSDFVSTLA